MEPAPVPPRPTSPVANNVGTTQKTNTPPLSRVGDGGASTTTTGAAQQSNNKVARRNAKSSTRGSHLDDRTAVATAIDEPSVITSATPKPQALQYKCEEDQWSPKTKPHRLPNHQEFALDSVNGVVRQFRGILNKLTPQKFQTLIDQILKLNIKDEETLGRVTQMIFDKATDEPGFSVCYANACVTLSKYLVVQNGKGERVSFKSLLLNKCQQEFQKDKSDTTAFEAMQKEIDEAESEEQKKQLKKNLQYEQMKAKRRSLGNIRFIGELYKLNMLTEKIMHECVLHLVKGVDEEALECLCRLLATIGKLIDTGKSTNRMDHYFVRIYSIIAKKQTSARVRFMLQDVWNLRLNKWVPRRDENYPKTIEQIHKEAQEEKVDKRLNAQRLAQEFRNNPLPRRDRGGQGRNVEGDGWNTAPVKANTFNTGKMKITTPMSSDDNIRMNEDRGGQGRNVGGDGWNTAPEKANTFNTGKMKITTPMSSDDNIQLGPGGSEQPKKNLTRFQMLAMQGDDSKRGSDSRTSMGPPPSLGPHRSDSREMDWRLGLGGPGGMGGRPSKERERESAMAAVRQLSSGGSRSGRLTPGGGSSRNQSRESSRNRDGAPYAAAPAPASATTPASVPAPDKLERKTKAIVDEYLQIHDLK